MKKYNEIVKLMVLALDESGVERDIVDVAVDAAAGGVSHIVMGAGKDYKYYALPFADIHGMGNDFITVLKTASIKNITEIEPCVYLNNMCVVSDDGCVVGNVCSFEFDEKSGKITGISYIAYDEDQHKNVVELTENFNIHPTMILMHGKIAETDSKPPKAAVKPKPEAVDEAVKEVKKAAPAEQTDMGYLLGKRLKYDVTSDDGEMVLAAGTIITEAVIKSAEEHNALLMLSVVAE